MIRPLGLAAALTLLSAPAGPAPTAAQLTTGQVAPRECLAINIKGTLGQGSLTSRGGKPVWTQPSTFTWDCTKGTWNQCGLCTITNLYAAPTTSGPWHFLTRAYLTTGVGKCSPAGSTANRSAITDTVPVTPGLAFRVNIGDSPMGAAVVDCPGSTYRFLAPVIFTVR